MIPRKSIGRMLDVYTESELQKNRKDLESSLFVDDAVEVEVASTITNENVRQAIVDNGPINDEPTITVNDSTIYSRSAHAKLSMYECSCDGMSPLEAL